MRKDAYLESRVLSASPLELICFLYQYALDSVRDARRHLAAGDIVARSRAVCRAVGVMTPLIALVVSLAFEGFRPDLLTALGAALAAVGNALMLWPAAVARASALEPMATARGDAPAGE